MRRPSAACVICRRSLARLTSAPRSAAIRRDSRNPAISAWLRLGPRISPIGPDARACGSIENPVRTGNARACGSTEPAGRWVEGDLRQERLVVGLAPAQPEEADLASIEIEFAADEPVDPLAMDRVPDAENRHRAL